MLVTIGESEGKNFPCNMVKDAVAGEQIHYLAKEFNIGLNIRDSKIVNLMSESGWAATTTICGQIL